MKKSPFPALAVALVLILAAAGLAAPVAAAPFLEEMRAARLVSGMLSSLHAALEAGKSVLLAGTQEEARGFLDEARAAAGVVEASREELDGMLQKNGNGAEKGLMADFGRAWAELHTVDQEFLSLAGENTNRQASALSVGPAAQAAARMEEALRRVLAAVQGGTGSAQDPAAQDAVLGPALEAVIACRKILFAQTPHIAEASDERMDAMERDMAAWVQEAEARLGHLAARPLPVPAAEALGQAREAWTEFLALHAQVLTLSRQNTGVRSLALALGRKRKAAAQCVSTLEALSTAILGRRGKATR